MCQWLMPFFTGDECEFAQVGRKYFSVNGVQRRWIRAERFAQVSATVQVGPTRPILPLSLSVSLTLFIFWCPQVLFKTVTIAFIPTRLKMQLLKKLSGSEPKAPQFVRNAFKKKLVRSLNQLWVFFSFQGAPIFWPHPKSWASYRAGVPVLNSI